MIRGFGSPEIPLKTNMAMARMESREKDEVNSSDWLYGCMSIQIHPEAVLTASVGPPIGKKQ